MVERHPGLAGAGASSCGTAMAPHPDAAGPVILDDVVVALPDKTADGVDPACQVGTAEEGSCSGGLPGSITGPALCKIYKRCACPYFCTCVADSTAVPSQAACPAPAADPTADRSSVTADEGGVVVAAPAGPPAELAPAVLDSTMEPPEPLSLHEEEASSARWCFFFAWRGRGARSRRRRLPWPVPRKQKTLLASACKYARLMSMN